MSTFADIKKRAKSEGSEREYTKKIQRISKKMQQFQEQELAESSDSEDDPDNYPFSLESVDEHAFERFFESEAKHPNGQWKAASTVEGYRSALIHYFESKKLSVPTILRGDVLTFVKGLKRTIASARRDGTYKESEGMDCLEFRSFAHICSLTASSNQPDAHAFLLLTWNLICRADTTTHLIYGCITWSNDALRIDIPKSKVHRQAAVWPLPINANEVAEPKGAKGAHHGAQDHRCD